MKTPLRYQITEFDCGSVSLLNCITFLYERKEIPAELVKAISTYTLDCYDEFGNLGQKGTSREAVQFITRWLCEYSKTKDFGLDCKYLSGQEVTIDAIRNCLKKNGCINFRTYQTCEHYVTITGIDEESVYIFDPYYSDEEHYKSNKFIKCVLNEPFKYNRVVSLERFLSETKHEFALGPVEKREALLLRRK